jgi:hypothetical protein
MRRHLALGLVLAAAGCHGVPPKVDPFYGVQIVPPPATAMNAPPSRTPPPDSYYSTPNTSGGSTPKPAADGRYLPRDGSFDYRGDEAAPAARGFQPVGGSQPGGTPSAAGAGLSGSPAGTSSGGATGLPLRSTNPNDSPPVRRDLTPPDGRYGPSSDSGGGFQPNTSLRHTNSGAATSAPTTRPQSGTWTTQPAGSTVPRGGETITPVRRTAVLPASYNAAMDESASTSDAQAPTAAAAHDPFGYDPQYAWLRGKLEYSLAERRWKLRYIPISGPTDAFGGSVVLVDIPQPDALRPGAFVTVYGQLDPQEVQRGGFAPTYRVQQIEPVR